MDAITFVQNNGWKNSIELLKECPEKYTYISPSGFSDFDWNDFVNKEELQNLINSWELVNLFDDIEQAKSWISDMYNNTPYIVRGNDRRFMRDELAQAITDVESVGKEKE